MKREEEQYEQWLNQVRTTPPVLEKPEELTRDILCKISQTSHPRRKTPIKSLIDWLSGIAACFLLCAMLYEVFFYPASFQRDGDTMPVAFALTTKKIREFPILPMAEGTVREKSTFIIKWRKDHKETLRLREGLMDKLMNDNH